MSNLEVAALIGVTFWLVVLTFVVVLTIRQVGLLLVKLATTSELGISLESGFSLDEDGLPVGSEIPDEVVARLPHLQQGRFIVMLVSAICVPCHNLAKGLQTHTIHIPLVALVTGRAPLADDLVALLPPHTNIIRDPDAAYIAHLCNIHSTPFAFATEDGEVVRKAYLRSVDDLLSLTVDPSNPSIEQIEKEYTHVS